MADRERLRPHRTGAVAAARVGDWRRDHLERTNDSEELRWGWVEYEDRPDLATSEASLECFDRGDRVECRMLGHASISTTADAYGPVTPAMAKRTAELMDAAIG